MTIVRHPCLDVSYNVPESRVAEWVASGWLTDAPPVELEPVVESGGKSKLSKSKPKK